MALLWHGQRVTEIESKKPGAPRSRRARAISELMPDVGGAAFRRFGFQQSAVVARWAEIVGEQYAQHCTPEALSFPSGKRSGGTLRVVVTGAFAPLLKAVEPQIIDRVNRFFGYGAVDRVALRHGDMPRKPARAAKRAGEPIAPETSATLRDIADPELRDALQSLAIALGSTKGPPIIR